MVVRSIIITMSLCKGNEIKDYIHEVVETTNAPTELKSTAWNDLVVKIMRDEMATCDMKIHVVETWQKYARKWRQKLPYIKASQSLPVFTGSYAEGMPNADDLDILFVDNLFKTYENIGPLSSDINNLPLTTDDCHPGYIRIIVPALTRRHYTFKGYQIRKIGRHFYLSSAGFIQTMKEWGTTGSELDVQGPALTGEGAEESSYDIVHAIKCSAWPSFIDDFFERDRVKSNIDYEGMKSMNMYVVATGHRLSNDSDIEWRLSFTEAEKYITKAWNETQRYCYYLLKQFKVIHLNNPDVLCSYYMKTILFWMSDVLPPAYWVPDNLNDAFFKALLVLAAFYRKHCVPNYFMPKNNMIDHKPVDDCNILCDKITLYLFSGEMNIVIAELLCEDDIEAVISLSNQRLRYCPTRSTRTFCSIIHHYNQMAGGSERARLVNEADLLSSLPIMMAIWYKEQSIAMEEVSSSVEDIVSCEFVFAFRTLIDRQIADFYHHMKTRNSKCKAEDLYKSSISLIYPSGFDDRQVSGIIQLALFYFLNREFDKAVQYLFPILPIITQIIDSNSVIAYLQISLPVWQLNRFILDKTLFDIVSRTQPTSPFVVHVIVIGLYTLIQSLSAVSSEGNKDHILKAIPILSSCGAQLETPSSVDSFGTLYSKMITELTKTMKLNIGQCRIPAVIKRPTRRLRLKHYHD